MTEAATLDGAGGLRRLAFITVPLLRPALLAALLLRGVDAIRVFATPLVLTGVEGVPVLSTYAYHQWSDYGNDGAAAAAASVLALLSVTADRPTPQAANGSMTESRGRTVVLLVLGLFVAAVDLRAAGADRQAGGYP